MTRPRAAITAQDLVYTSKYTTSSALAEPNLLSILDGPKVVNILILNRAGYAAASRGRKVLIRVQEKGA
jgi:hypothetical protein